MIFFSADVTDDDDNDESVCKMSRMVDIINGLHCSHLTMIKSGDPAPIVRKPGLELLSMHSNVFSSPNECIALFDGASMNDRDT